jgi:hypothetical protein
LKKGADAYVPLSTECHCEERSAEPIQLNHPGALRALRNELIEFVIASPASWARQSS